jgi:hypothetical protein
MKTKERKKVQPKAVITLTQVGDDVTCDIKCDQTMNFNTPLKDMLPVHKVVAKFIAAMKDAIEPGSFEAK